MSGFIPALRLTTPHMTGQNVRDAQWLLAGNNPYPGLAPYKNGQIDGDFGPLTAGAAKQAKFWLGYPISACLPTFGQAIYSYLRPTDPPPLPPAYATRRALRLSAATPGWKALELARLEVGTEESPRGSNHQKYGEWYGWNGVPWCVIFESWCFAHSGHPAFRYAAVELVVHDAMFNRNGLRLVQSPQQGDLACYTIGGKHFAHSAFFDQWIDGGSNGTFWDLGGNTGPNDISNGGAVLRQERDVSLVAYWVRVG